MLKSTKGIVLNQVKYGETSLIVKIYTQDLGMQSFLANGVRKKKSRFQASLFQVLTLLEMEVYYKSSRQVQRIKEVKPYYLFSQIPFDIVKSSMALFWAEVIYKSVQSEGTNVELFHFLEQKIIQLDEQNQHFRYLPLTFLIELSRYLGFYPNNNHSQQRPFFDLQEGFFMEEHIPYQANFGGAKSLLFSQLLQAVENKTSLPVLTRTQSKELLQELLRYYKIHLNNFPPLKSLEVLAEVLH